MCTYTYAVSAWTVHVCMYWTIRIYDHNIDYAYLSNRERHIEYTTHHIPTMLHLIRMHYCACSSDTSTLHTSHVHSLYDTQSLHATDTILETRSPVWTPTSNLSRSLCFFFAFNAKLSPSFWTRLHSNLGLRADWLYCLEMVVRNNCDRPIHIFSFIFHVSL